MYVLFFSCKAQKLPFLSFIIIITIIIIIIILF